LETEKDLKYKVDHFDQSLQRNNKTIQEINQSLEKINIDQEKENIKNFIKEILRIEINIL